MKAIAIGLCTALLTLAACDRMSAPKPPAGAVYADQLPVFPKAVYEDSMGGSTSDGFGGPAVSESRSWFYKVPESENAAAVQFYEQQLPHAQKEVEDGETRFVFAPRGGDEGEEITIRVEPGELQITESVKPGKRKD